jgi:hypothetical protein
MKENYKLGELLFVLCYPTIRTVCSMSACRFSSSRRRSVVFLAQHGRTSSLPARLRVQISPLTKRHAFLSQSFSAMAIPNPPKGGPDGDAPAEAFETVGSPLQSYYLQRLRGTVKEPLDKRDVHRSALAFTTSIVSQWLNL